MFIHDIINFGKLESVQIDGRQKLVALTARTFCFKLCWRDNLEQNSPSCQVAFRAVESQPRARYQNKNRAPCKNDKNNGLSKMIKRMIRQNTHFVISKSINNQKKVNNTLERMILTQEHSQPKISGGGSKTS